MRMEKDKTPFLRSIILCFHPRFYPFVLRQSGWRSFIYLALICAIVYGFLGFWARVVYQRDEEVLSGFYRRGFPEFHFQNGEADYPPDTPHIYEEKVGNGLWAIVVDTSEQTTDLDEKYDAGILITRKEIVLKGADGGVRRGPIPKTDEKVVATDLFINFLQMHRPSPPFFYIVNLVGKLLLVAMTAGVLFLADKGKANPYPYAYYFNVGCYAVTPFVISALARAWQAGSFMIYASYGVSLLLSLTLAALGLAKCRQEDAREPHSAKASGVAGQIEEGG